MAKIKRMTLKHWGNDSNLLFSQNVTKTAAQQELNDFLKAHPEYKEYPLYGIPQEAVGFDITKSNTIRIQRPAVVEENLEENASPAAQNDDEGATPTDAE